MAASPLSIGTCSQCFFASSSVDHSPSLHHFPCHKSNLLKTLPKLKIRLCHSQFSPTSVSSISRASTAFDCIGLSENGEEGEGEVDEEPESGVEKTASKEENGAWKSAEGERLYVGNLPFSGTSAQLSEIFAEAGRVVAVEIIYDRVTDRSRGFAFVTMGTIDEAKEAIRLFNRAQIGGRTAFVNFPEVPRGGERKVMSPKIRSTYHGSVDTPHRIYAGNLSWGLTSKGLREVFAAQPGFLSAKVIYDRDSGRSRGFGFITFSSAEEVESALNAMNGLELEGRPLRLNLAEQKAAAFPSSPVETMSGNNLENTDA